MFLNDYHIRMRNNTRNISDTDATYTYDAVWAIVDALNRSEPEIQSTHSLNYLNYSYGDARFGPTIRNKILNADFSGTSVSQW